MSDYWFGNDGTFPFNGYCSMHGWYSGQGCPMCAAKQAEPFFGADAAPSMVVVEVPTLVEVPVVPKGYRLIKEETVQRLGTMIDDLIDIFVELVPEIDGIPPDADVSNLTDLPTPDG